MAKRVKIDPKSVGLHHNTVLEQTGKDTYVIVMNRKSRIIMKDGKAILQKTGNIKQTYPKAKVSVETNAPVCSKTRAFLAENDVNLVEK